MKPLVIIGKTKNKFGSSEIITIFALKQIEIMFTLHSNQYIPYRAKTLPSGMPACSTYYYLKNANGKVVDKKTLKPYRGKQMDRYAMHSKAEAEAYLEVINK